MDKGDPDQPDIDAIIAAGEEAGEQVEAILNTARTLWRFYGASTAVGFAPDQVMQLTTEYFRLLWAQAQAQQQVT